jgi:N-acetylglucosaminyldiphosphoundecaprenol N-acetyl-beta-D-mannosaminyltransferase
MANILGINLGDSAPVAAFGQLREFLKDGGQHYVVTPNPEMILAAHQDEELFYILNKADLSLADGFGLKVAGWLFGERIFRQTGADLIGPLLAEAEKQEIKVLVLNWRDGLSAAAEIQAAAKRQYPKLDIMALDADREAPLPTEVNERINAFAPAILFNTFGCPYQEKIIYHNLAKWPSVKLALAVGGAFDYITGRAQRAPQIWRAAGLEWLWRLIRQPRRFRRIYRATIVFLRKVIAARFLNPFRYRPNVACLMYKNENGTKKILLVERQEEKNHWQLPQGGLDGQPIAVAGAREIREETGALNFVTKGTFKNVSCYDFLNPEEKFRHAENHPIYDSKKYKFDYKGQRQSLYIAEFTGSDSEIKINFWDHAGWKWVPADRLLAEVHPVRQSNTKIFLEKFKSLNL